MVRLFRAWSLLDEFMGHDQVMFNWFVAGRPVPIVPYEELIEDFDEDQEEVGYDKMLANELLTEAEVGELREYLIKHHNVEVQVEEVLLPIQAGGLSYGLLLISGENGFYSLADEETYELRVPILGHYKVEEDPTSLLSIEEIEIGTIFLGKIFDNLKISAIDQNQKIGLLKEIYEETGLLVKRDKKKSERMSNRRIKN